MVHIPTPLIHSLLSTPHLHSLPTTTPFTSSPPSLFPPQLPPPPSVHPSPYHTFLHRHIHVVFLLQSTRSNAGSRWWLLKILEWSTIAVSFIGAISLLTHSNCCGDSTIARCTTPLDTGQLLHFQAHKDGVRILPHYVSPGGADFLAQLPNDGNRTCPVRPPGVQLLHINAGISNQFDQFSWFDRLWCATIFTFCLLPGK